MHLLFYPCEAIAAHLMSKSHLLEKFLLARMKVEKTDQPNNCLVYTQEIDKIYN